MATIELTKVSKEEWVDAFIASIIKRTGISRGQAAHYARTAFEDCRGKFSPSEAVEIEISYWAD